MVARYLFFRGYLLFARSIWYKLMKLFTVVSQRWRNVEIRRSSYKILVLILFLSLFIFAVDKLAINIFLLITINTFFFAITITKSRWLLLGLLWRSTVLCNSNIALFNRFKIYILYFLLLLRQIWLFHWHLRRCLFSWNNVLFIT